MSSELAKKMKATAEELVMSFNGPWTKETAAAATAARAPECMHVILPTSLGMPPRSNAEWVGYFEGLEGFVTDCTMKVHDTIVGVEDRRVVVRSAMTSTTPVGDFLNEYAWFFTFDEAGQKITEVVEMMDTAAVIDILTRRAQANA